VAANLGEEKLEPAFPHRAEPSCSSSSAGVIFSSDAPA
jgi:hypothetical protein